MGNLRCLPPSAPTVDGLEQPAGGGLLCCAPAPLTLSRRPPLPNGERPLRRSRCTAEHRGCKGRATSDSQANTRHEQGRIRWSAAVLELTATVGASAGRREAGGCLARPPAHRWLGRPALLGGERAPWLGRPPGAARPPARRCSAARRGSDARPALLVRSARLGRPPDAAQPPARRCSEARALARPPARRCLASAARPTLARRGRTPLVDGRRAGGRNEKRSAAAVE
jgi:hypothetical protein